MKSSSIWKCGALKVANFQERCVWGGGILGGTGDFEAQVQILDVSGKLLKSTTQMFFANEPSLLDLNNLPAGYYTVKVLNAGKPVLTEKLVITR